ncbi:MAG: hypothetical protein MJ228_00585 [Bacilli bacterium]|nr:hypothetical protein [Bacilli bacterium]
MNYEETIKYLQSCDMTMSRYERNNWDLFVRKMGVMIEVPFIHITGSNGKGSTANYLVEIYKAAGYKVALFSKPFLVKPNEMIRVGDEDISDEDFARIFSYKEKEYEKFNLSSFEIETYIAFEYFNEQKPDIAIIECGMGGETDCTNLYDAKPVLSIITTVSLEHTAFLGRTTSEIARSKSAIIKDKRPVLVGAVDEQVEQVIKDIAVRKEAPFKKVDAYHHPFIIRDKLQFDYSDYSKLIINTPAIYQIKNACLAIEATKILNDQLPVNESHIRLGLEAKPLPCRLERHGNIIIDGAHNPEAVDLMMQSVSMVSESKPIHVVFASYRDKNIAVELPRIGKDVADIVLTTFDSKRARDEMDYFLYAADYSYNENFKEAIKELVENHPNDLILITGSLAFASVARTFVIKELGL